MATIGISEFTFGYAFLFEQTSAKWKNLKAAPILPSLQKEKDEGWDAHLPTKGADYYYQFKLTDYLQRGNSTHIANGTYSDPYFRFDFHKRDKCRQHRRLRIHSKTNPRTFYVVPEFSKLEDFNAAFLGKQIALRSRLISLKNCKDVNDSKPHCITFQPNKRQWTQWSEPHFQEESFYGRDLEELYRRQQADWREINDEFAADLFMKTAGTIRENLSREERDNSPTFELLDFSPEHEGRNRTLDRIANVISVFYGATMVLVGQPSKSQ